MSPNIKEPPSFVNVSQSNMKKKKKKPSTKIQMNTTLTELEKLDTCYLFSLKTEENRKHFQQIVLAQLAVM